MVPGKGLGLFARIAGGVVKLLGDSAVVFIVIGKSTRPEFEQRLRNLTVAYGGAAVRRLKFECLRFQGNLKTRLQL